MVNLLEIGQVLNRRGKTVTLRNIAAAVSADGGAVATTAMDTPVQAIVRSYRTNEVRGLVEEGDREIVFAAGAIPFTPFPERDQVVIDGKATSIMTVATTYDAGSPVVYRLHVRG